MSWNENPMWSEMSQLQKCHYSAILPRTNATSSTATQVKSHTYSPLPTQSHPYPRFRRRNPRRGLQEYGGSVCNIDQVDALATTTAYGSLARELGQWTCSSQTLPACPRPRALRVRLRVRRAGELVARALGECQRVTEGVCCVFGGCGEDAGGE